MDNPGDCPGGIRSLPVLVHNGLGGPVIEDEEFAKNKKLLVLEPAGNSQKEDVYGSDRKGQLGGQGRPKVKSRESEIIRSLVERGKTQSENPDKKVPQTFSGKVLDLEGRRELGGFQFMDLGHERRRGGSPHSVILETWFNLTFLVHRTNNSPVEILLGLR